MAQEKKLKTIALKHLTWVFPAGSGVKNPPANAGDMGSIPGPEGSHMPKSNEARKPQLLRLCSGVQALHLLSLRAAVPEAGTP